MIIKTIRQNLLMGGLACLAPLAALSVMMMYYLEDFEDPRFKLLHLGKLHLVWYIIGLIGFGFSFMLAKKHSSWFAWASFSLATLILASAFLQEKTAHGLPYLQFGKLYINAAEASAILFLIPIAFFMGCFNHQVLAKYSISALLVLFFYIGSDNATTCLGLAIAALFLLHYRDMRHASTLMLSTFSFVIALMPILKGLFSISKNVQQAVTGSNLFILYDPSAGANGHTELIFSHIAERFGVITAFSCLILILFIITQLVILSLMSKDRGVRFALAGLAVFLVGQVLFDMLVATNIIVNPDSGVSLPFISYGGSQLVMELIVTGGFIGLFLGQSQNAKKSLDQIHEL